MGYRSVVAYTIRFDGGDFGDDKAKASFFTFITEAKAKEETAGAFLDEDLKVDEKKLALYFYADHVKWYESYPDVQCHEALMELSRDWADDEETNCPYIGGAFARIGEEMEDMVEECWGQGDYDWIAIHRTMQCDWIK